MAGILNQCHIWYFSYTVIGKKPIMKISDLINKKQLDGFPTLLNIISNNSECCAAIRCSIKARGVRPTYTRPYSPCLPFILIPLSAP